MEKLPYERDSNTVVKAKSSVFENITGLIKASEFCERFGYSMKTIYEWKYRPKRNKVPDGLVVKFRGKLFISSATLGSLIASNTFPTREG